MFDSTVLTFYAKAETVAKIEELMKKTGLSRSQLIVLLIERAQVEPVMRYDVGVTCVPAGKDDKP